MVGSGGSSSARVSGVERFYSPPAVRKQLELQKQQQKLQQQQQQQQKEATPRTRPSPAATKVRVAEDRLEPDDASSKPSVSSSSSPSLSPTPTPIPTPPPTSPYPVGNLDRLLESTTPVVPARYFSKASTRVWRNGDEVESQPYFCLGDLWESFKEWSAYGAGVPLVLNGSDSVVQYYVPYLSAIQLYMDTCASTLRSGRSAEESDGFHYLDSSSEGSSESEENQLKESSSLGTTSHIGKGSFVNDGSEVSPKPKLPVFEYFERDPPYGREPLADKISVLANIFPNLKTYRSCDMLPSSWMSVAWYPIYRIPTGPTLKDLDACFLTFHSLANPSNDASPPSEVLGSCTNRNVKSSSNDRHMKLYLPVFGLASYKFRGSIWTSCGLHERQLASSLLQAADNWLRLLQVDHPDYRFFLSHSNTFRR